MVDTADFTVDASELAHKITLRISVTRTREMKFRFWLGSKVLRMAAWILPCVVEIEMNS